MVMKRRLKSTRKRRKKDQKVVLEKGSGHDLVIGRDQGLEIEKDQGADPELKNQREIVLDPGIVDAEAGPAIAEGGHVQKATTGITDIKRAKRISETRALKGRRR